MEGLTFDFFGYYNFDSISNCQIQFSQSLQWWSNFVSAICAMERETGGEALREWLLHCTWCSALTIAITGTGTYCFQSRSAVMLVVWPTLTGERCPAIQQDRWRCPPTHSWRVGGDVQAMTGLRELSSAVMAWTSAPHDDREREREKV